MMKNKMLLKFYNICFPFILKHVIVIETHIRLYKNCGSDPYDHCVKARKLQ